MNLHFSYKHAQKTPQAEKIIARRVEKVNKLLATFAPDLVHLHGTLEYQNPREGFSTSLNLRLPVGQIHATRPGRNPQVSLRAAFDDLERQINKEKSLLRGDGKFRRALKATGEAGARIPKVPPRKAKRRSISLS